MADRTNAPMRRRLRDFFDLVRLPNLFTAAADSVAGFFYAGGAAANADTWIRLGLTSMLLYAGGVALNDVCDATTDSVERPARPIPSGRVTKSTAFAISILLLFAGISIALTLSVRCGMATIAIALCIVAYDAVVKGTILAPLLMGGCRAFNLLLGMVAAGPVLQRHWVAPAALMLVYVSSLTFFARREARSSSRVRLALGIFGIVVSVAAVFFLTPRSPQGMEIRFAVAVGGLILWLGFNGMRAVISPSPAIVQRAVKRSVMAVVFFDACLILTKGMTAQAIGVASLYIPTVLLARRMRVT